MEIFASFLLRLLDNERRKRKTENIFVLGECSKRD